jgi:uncharacterized damage-inducible protein DinB
MDPDLVLREQLVSALKGGNAHAPLEEVVANFPAHQRGEKAGLPYSAWQLLEHMLLAQADILRFSTNHDGRYKAMKFPADYWSRQQTPPSEKAWDDSVKALIWDRNAMIALLNDPANELTEPFPWGDGTQNLLREAVLIIDHTAYHLGELLVLRRLLGVWRSEEAA